MLETVVTICLLPFAVVAAIATGALIVGVAKAAFGKNSH